MLDLEKKLVRVERVAIEVGGKVADKPYPKSRASRRVVPLPAFAADLLEIHLATYPRGPQGELFTNMAGGPLMRGLFRTRVWRPSLVRAGLMGKVVQDGRRWHGASVDKQGLEQVREDATYRQAVAAVSRGHHGGLHFHDLRHPYCTWLVSDGVPISYVQQVMGHEQASTTLGIYTHASAGRDERVLEAFADFWPSERGRAP